MTDQASSTAPMAVSAGWTEMAVIGQSLGGSARAYVIGVVRIAFGALAILPWISAQVGAPGFSRSLLSPLVRAHPMLWEGGLPARQGMMDGACTGLATHAACLADVIADVLRLPTGAADIRSGEPSGGIVGPAAWIDGPVVCGLALLASRGLRAVPPRADTKH